jgi:hypothetical protein
MNKTRRTALAVLLLLGCTSSPAHAGLLDQLVDAFVAITDTAEFQTIKSQRLSGVTKWSIPIEYNVIGATSQEAVKGADSHMQQLAQLSGLEIKRRPGFALNDKAERRPIDDVHTLTAGFEFATMQEDKLRPGPVMNAVADKAGPQARGWLGNFTILFAQRRLLERVFDHLRFDRTVREQFVTGRTVCFQTGTMLKTSRDPRLAIVLIPTDQEAWLIRRCLVEETTQALGLINDIPGSTLTLFDDRPDRRRTELTAYDQMFLRVLYHPEMKLGMTGAELRSTARRLIEAELSKQH